jgi:hypothetical protein
METIDNNYGEADNDKIRNNTVTFRTESIHLSKKSVPVLQSHLPFHSFYLSLQLKGHSAERFSFEHLEQSYARTSEYGPGQVYKQTNILHMTSFGR